MILKTFIPLSIYFSLPAIGQTHSPLDIQCNYANKDSDLVKLIVINHADKTYYYSITLQGLIDNTWKPIISDINSLGMNEFTALKPLKANSRIQKFVSKRKIYLNYSYLRPGKIRFGVMFYTKKDFDLKGDIIYTSSL